MKPGPIQPLPVPHPYYSAEHLAGQWNLSLATFLRRHKAWRLHTMTTGKGRGQVWYNRDDVVQRLGQPPSKRFKMPHPYARAERCAAALNMSLSAFKRWAKKVRCVATRKGKGRGFVWFNWDHVRRKFQRAGFSNIPGAI